MKRLLFLAAFAASLHSGCGRSENVTANVAATNAAQSKVKSQKRKVCEGRWSGGDVEGIIIPKDAGRIFKETTLMRLPDGGGQIPRFDEETMDYGQWEAMKKRFPELKAELVSIRESLPQALTNEDSRTDAMLLAKVDKVLDGIDADWQGMALVAAFGPGSGCGGMTSFVHLANSPEAKIRAVNRYFKFFNAIADWVGRRSGYAFKAAEIDRGIYNVLKYYLAQRHPSEEREVVQAVERNLAIWKAERCDSPDSNFCRSHQNYERYFNHVFAEKVRKDPIYGKALERNYRFHLKWARRILGRPPKWEPPESSPDLF